MPPKMQPKAIKDMASGLTIYLTFSPTKYFF